MPLDLDAYLDIPRLSGLVVTPDGRLLVHAAQPDAAGTAFATEILELDPRADARPSADSAAGVRRLAGRRPGLSVAATGPDSSLLLLDARTDPEAAPDEPAAEDPVPALWRLPAHGGEAEFLAATPAGVEAVAVAADAGTIVLRTQVFPGATTFAADRDKAAARRKAGTSALLFDGYPFRFWDTPLAPRGPRLYVLDDDGSPRDLTGDAGIALALDGSFDITPDGRTVVATWNIPGADGAHDNAVVAIDVATGKRRILLQDKGIHQGEVVCSPDGSQVAMTRVVLPTPERPWHIELWVVELADGTGRRVAAGFDLHPQSPQWTPDGQALVFTADENGRTPLFRVDLADPDASAVRLTADGAYAGPRLSPDGRTVYALHSAWDTPPQVVALDTAAADQCPRVVHVPLLAEPLPGRLHEVHTTAADGTPLRSWLIVPTTTEAAGADPAPLLVIPHGGPVSSWSQWSWRWQPQLFAARGYAVLMPDPALSTGYGSGMLERGWNQWGGTPYTDVMALTDAALQRPDLDATRTGIAGASYGGYLTNWIIGHTDRFRCAVSHAGIWQLDHMRVTTDDAADWDSELGTPDERPEHYRHWAPASYAARISTPTLVIHGEQDYRCPVGEGLALYGELRRRGVESALLYLPDENHWVRRPGNITVWYETVLAWLDHHILDLPWQRPDLL